MDLKDSFLKYKNKFILNTFIKNVEVTEVNFIQTLLNITMEYHVQHLLTQFKIIQHIVYVWRKKLMNNENCQLYLCVGFSCSTLTENNTYVYIYIKLHIVN